MSAAKGYIAAKPLAHDGVEYLPGDPVDLDAECAAHLLATGVVTAGKAAAAPKGDDDAGDSDEADDTPAKPRAKRKPRAKD